MGGWWFPLGGMGLLKFLRDDCSLWERVVGQGCVFVSRMAFGAFLYV
jgi:hypothetical protein